MKLLTNSNISDFMLGKALAAIPNVFKRTVKAVDPIQGPVSLAEAMTEAQKLHNTSKWGNRLNAAMIATTPLTLAPVVMKGADTKAIEAMRLEDKRREALGLPPLATNKQIAQTQAQPTGFSKTNGDVRIIDLTPSNIVKL